MNPTPRQPGLLAYLVEAGALAAYTFVALYYRNAFAVIGIFTTITLIRWVFELEVSYNFIILFIRYLHGNLDTKHLIFYTTAQLVGGLIGLGLLHIVLLRLKSS